MSQPARLRSILSAAIMASGLAAALSSCAAPVGPVEVTRFVAPDAPVLGKGPIRIEPASGEDASSLEFRTYSAAVSQELARLGYTQALPGETLATGQVAVLSVERRTLVNGQPYKPVSVGLGGVAGSYGSGVGMGLGINLSGRPQDQIETRMQVMIRDGSAGATLWEGRASFMVGSKSPLAQTSLAAAKMAQALFQGFPGKSGETIQVK